MLGSIARKRLFNGKARRFSSIRPNHDPPPALPNAFGGTYDWEDPFRLEESLTEEERMLKHAARGFCEGELFPGIIKANRKEITLDHNLMQKMGECGFLGCTLPEKYGGCDFGYVSYGLMAAEIEMVDSSYRSAMSVQSSLVMYPIANYASNEKLKLKYLPELAAGRMIGCFGLTEPNHGSDPGSMETTAVLDRAANEVILNGSKTWITNAPIADVFIIWAKRNNLWTGFDEIKGYIVEKDALGLSTNKIEGKFSLRASCTGAIFMDDVRVPVENELTVTGLKGPFSCLNHARFGISWGVTGAADFCLHAARVYTMDREQFGHPLASTQLMQKKFADMTTEIALARQASLTVGRLMEQGKASPEQVSIVKRNNCLKSLDIARTARDMLGGNGICDEFHVIRHVMNLEAVNTYEGTADIHALIIGKAITGMGAFGPRRKQSIREGMMDEQDEEEDEEGGRDLEEEEEEDTVLDEEDFDEESGDVVSEFSLRSQKLSNLVKKKY